MPLFRTEVEHTHSCAVLCRPDTVAGMDLPVAPPAFDATTGPGPHRRADLGADIGAGCGQVFLEAAALVVMLGRRLLSGFDLDPAKPVRSRTADVKNRS